MFATYGGFRRRVAVLMVLSLVASVLVTAAPVSAADDPEPDFGATFDACAGASESGFSDVPAGHANAGDIDCIAYYGITKGTSATTYSPLSGVTREHMALFLMRLAGLVGITVPPAGDTDFTDTGDLSAESQAAISQLAQLEITQGYSDTTFSPADEVRRDHMALFVQRLMNIMDPMTDGKDEDGDYGYTPSDVVDNDQGKTIGSPFTDLGLVTKSAYDAITELYELEVASGISGTAYGPSSLITRASMAGFMAAVLDHSNARPAGLSIQASKTSGFGAVGATVVVSVRDDSFAAVADQAVDIFSSEASDGGLTFDGGCVEDPADAVVGDCTWNSNDEFTDGDGNIIDDTAGAAVSATNVYYAWIGDKDGQDFDADDADEVTVSIASSNPEAGLKVSSSISDNANDNRVNLNKTSRVTFTVQLVDNSKVAVGKNVARSGIKITVGVTRSGDENNSNTNAANLTTDDDGKATYTVDRPTPDKDKDGQNRTDSLTFIYASGDDTGISGIVKDTGTIKWVEEDSATTSVKASAPSYVIRDADGDATVRGTVTLYDQYGNGFREGSGQQVTININGDKGDANVNRNGVGSRSFKVENHNSGKSIKVTFIADPVEKANVIIEPKLDNPDYATVQVVTRADPDDTEARGIHTFYADDNEFTTTTELDKKDANKLYSYDSDDTFTSGGSVITMAKFEELLAQPAIGENKGEIDVLIYDPEGSSIFKVTKPA